MNLGQIPPSFLKSMHAQPMKWYVALGELCDNSFDAGASRVEITFGPSKTVTVSDDGAGCDNIERMLTLGEHFRQSTTQLGRWGVGLKEAACWLWGELTIRSVKKSVEYGASIDWQRVSSQKDWNVPDPTTLDAEPGQVGTTLIFRNTRRNAPEYESLSRELSYTFAPGLWAGKQIVLKFQRRKPIPCAAWTLPDLEQIVQDRFEVNGKRVKLTAGIVSVDTINPRPGFSYSHGHRIITNTAYGSKGLSVSRICGVVELDAAWMLSKNKTEIVDHDQELLEDAIYERCENILRQSAQQAELLRNSALESEVSDGLRAMLGSSVNSKAKRKPNSNATGTVKPSGNGVKHKKARETQPGNTFDDIRNIGSVRMEWSHRTDGLIGHVDLKGNVIYLNEDHSRLSHHKSHENKDALIDVCMNLLTFEAIESKQRDKLPFVRDYDGFIEALSNVLESQQATDEMTKKNTRPVP